MPKNTLIRRALLSVANKEGILELAQELAQQSIEIIATGGTASLLKQYHLSITEVSEYTGFPEILQGRVKTLHPKIFGGILQRGKQDLEDLNTQDISPIDLVVVNLYPFQETIQKQTHSLADAIEQIDIGGVSLIRAAAKNFHQVIVLVDPKDYGIFCELLRQQAINDDLRLQFAQKAFQYIAWYDGIIANYFQNLFSKVTQTFPDRVNLLLEKQSNLRYGENPQQQAALYQLSGCQEEQNTLATAKLLQGKPLSYNNLIDADTAFECALSFSKQPACVIVKHATPCGVAIGEDLLSAYHRAYQTDATSAFGGIIAVNQELDAETVTAIINKQFVEVLIAPAITNEAALILAQKPSLRVLITGQIKEIKARWDMHSISGGILIQEHDQGKINEGQLQFVTSRKPTDRQLQDLLFAWRVVKFVKSNAIVFAHNQASIAIGGGQTSRIFSIKSAILKAQEAGLELTGSVMASDAFFPFRDSIDVAASHGITAIIQPGGSVRDEEVILAAEETDIAMVLTGQRHFRH